MCVCMSVCLITNVMFIIFMFLDLYMIFDKIKGVKFMYIFKKY